jgi:hypothetical protein
LQVSGYDPKLIDGKFGPMTYTALQSFCENSKVDKVENIYTELFRKGLLLDYTTDWQGMLENKQFKNWLQKQSGDYQSLKIEPIKISGGGCGCSRDYSGRKVYGFYPYWFADGKKQIIDYSLLTHIGYYMLRLNKKGEIKNDLHWTDTYGIARFINRSHKHRVKVDITLYAENWQNWSQDAIDIAVNSITDIVTKKYKAHEVSLMRRIFPLVQDTSSANADGVNIYFDGFSEPTSSKQIMKIVKGIKTRLMKKKSNAKINLTLGIDFTKKNTILFKALKDVVWSRDGEKEIVLVDMIYIFLSGDTSKQKKTLRQEIETAYDGEGELREKVLRKIVPVLFPPETSGDVKQFKDDLIYAKDNFAGIGIWPLPLMPKETNCESMLEKQLTSHFLAHDKDNQLVTIIDQNIPDLCRFVCPNRWLFRIAFDLLVGLLLIYALIALWNCRLREFYRSHFLEFLVITLISVLILLISRICDPFLKAHSDEIVISLFLVATAGIVWRYVRKAMQPPLP